MTAWKLRDSRHQSAVPAQGSDVTVFVAPDKDQTFQNTGVLRLNAAESDDLARRLQGLNRREYERLTEFLTEWADNDEEARKLLAIVQLKLNHDG